MKFSYNKRIKFLNLFKTNKIGVKIVKIMIDTNKIIPPGPRTLILRLCVKEANGFVYSVNLKGITGVKTAQVNDANDQVKRIKKHTNLPVVAGFGIKTEKDVMSFSKSDCSGIVIGSAIVEKITESVKKNEDKHIVANVIKEYCKKLIENLN